MWSKLSKLFGFKTDYTLFEGGVEGLIPIHTALLLVAGDNFNLIEYTHDELSDESILGAINNHQAFAVHLGSDGNCYVQVEVVPEMNREKIQSYGYQILYQSDTALVEATSSNLIINDLSPWSEDSEKDSYLKLPVKPGYYQVCFYNLFLGEKDYYAYEDDELMEAFDQKSASNFFYIQLVPSSRGVTSPLSELPSLESM